MKILDEQGLQYLWKQISLEDYPNNETLIAVLNAIDETKADKDEVKPADLVANITGNIIDGYTCNVPFVDLWAAHDAGRDVVFNISDMVFTNADFVITASQSDSEVKQVRITFFNGEGSQLYIIGEDDTVSRSNYNFITKSGLKQETGTSKMLPMSQKAVTGALALKADQTSLDEVSTLVGDTPVATQISNATTNYYTKAEIDAYEFITIADIDEICGGVTEESLPQSDIDELMAQLG